MNGVLVIFALISHLRTCFSNPGWTPNLTAPINDSFSTTCDVCNQYKPARTHHCKKCKKCVHKLDHHCFWVNNCVGGLNQKYFMLFLFYTTASCGLAIVTVSCTMHQISKTIRYQPDFLGISLVLLFTIIEISFFLFAGSLFLDQFESVVENQTCVESYQSTRGIFQDKYKNIEDVFGKNFWLWPLPVDPNLKVDYFEIILVRKLN